MNILWLFDIYCPTLIVFLVILGGYFRKVLFCVRFCWMSVSTHLQVATAWEQMNSLMLHFIHKHQPWQRQQLMLGVIWKVFRAGFGWGWLFTCDVSVSENSLSFEVMLTQVGYSTSFDSLAWQPWLHHGVGCSKTELIIWLFQKLHILFSSPLCGLYTIKKLLSCWLWLFLHISDRLTWIKCVCGYVYSNGVVVELKTD